MTWAQSSGRNFNFAKSPTPSRVSPCSYNVPRDPPKKPIHKRDPHFKPRVTYDQPDLITPGPGSYECDVVNVKKELSRPQSSIFLSRTLRDIYTASQKVDPMSKQFPSSVDYGAIKEWGKRKEILSTPHHPRKLDKNYKRAQTCNFLDSKGRFVHVQEIKHTEADVGPGYYSPEKSEKAVYQESRKSEICRMDRSTGSKWIDMKNVGFIPSPDSYNVDLPNSRLPVTIKGQYETKKPKAICDTLMNPPQNSSKSKRPSSVFASRVPRDQQNSVDKFVTPSPVDYGHLYDPVEEGRLKAQRSRSRLVKGLAFGSKAVRFDKSETKTPGPADYTPAKPPQKKEFGALSETSQFLSRTPKGVELNGPSQTPDKVGPGSYESKGPLDKRKPQMSPAFIDGSSRMGNADNGVPSPADYTVKVDREKDATFVNTRYDKKGNWIYESVHASPSPADYSITRNLGGPKLSFPKAKSKSKKPKKENLGPGTYETNTSSVIHRSFNINVPKY